MFLFGLVRAYVRTVDFCNRAKRHKVSFVFSYGENSGYVILIYGSGDSIRMVFLLYAYGVLPSIQFAAGKLA